MLIVTEIIFYVNVFICIVYNVIFYESEVFQEEFIVYFGGHFMKYLL